MVLFYALNFGNMSGNMGTLFRLLCILIYSVKSRASIVYQVDYIHAQ